MDAKTFYLTATAAQIVLPFLLVVMRRPLELALPLRQSAAPLPLRWWANLPLAMASNALGILGSYTLAERIGSYGASFNLFSLAAAPLPGILKFIVGLLIIDAMAFLKHVLSHKIGLLWRLHQIHHSDADFDGSTGLRHHALEGFVSLCVLTFGFGLLGMPFAIIATYGVIMAVHSVLSHANVAIPAWLNRVLCWIVVTPDMHRLHHAADPKLYDSNYGELFPYWDWLARTFTVKSISGQVNMPLGLTNRPEAGEMSALELTLLAFESNREQGFKIGESRKRNALPGDRQIPAVKIVRSRGGPKGSSA